MFNTGPASMEVVHGNVGTIVVLWLVHVTGSIGKVPAESMDAIILFSSSFLHFLFFFSGRVGVVFDFFCFSCRVGVYFLCLFFFLAGDFGTFSGSPGFMLSTSS